MSEWKYIKEELPPLNTLVLCFTGQKMFGAYDLGELVENSLGQDEFHLLSNPSECGCMNVYAWQLLPDAPEFNRKKK